MHTVTPNKQDVNNAKLVSATQSRQQRSDIESRMNVLSPLHDRYTKTATLERTASRDSQ